MKATRPCSERKQQPAPGLKGPIWHVGCCWKASAALVVFTELLSVDGWLPLKTSQPSWASAINEQAEYSSRALVRLNSTHSLFSLQPQSGYWMLRGPAELRVPTEKGKESKYKALCPVLCLFRQVPTSVCALFVRSG